MKKLIILGAGTAGTMVANQLRGRLDGDWSIAVVDPDVHHLYQPGLIFLPFGTETEERIVRKRARTLHRGIDWVRQAVARIDADAKEVVLASGERLAYDLLVIATGTQVRPDETEGMLGPHWGESVHEFYTLEGAQKLRRALASFDGGRFVVNVVEMPIKCPVAPLELTFLADEYFTRRGTRDRVELVYATPLDGAFTKPIASSALGYLLEQKNVRLESEFSTGEVDGEAKVLRSWDEREVPYDLLVTVPVHGGAPFIGASGLGNEMDFVPTARHSLLAKGRDDVFVIGDATDLPTSKAGSVAHFQSEVLVENVLRTIAGRSLVDDFDGHANCFVETGFGKALLVDFNYDVEPLPGSYPLPGVGPFRLLKETRMNHWGKLGFRWLYWNALLPGRPLPVPNQMSMVGKRQPQPELVAA